LGSVRVGATTSSNRWSSRSLRSVSSTVVGFASPDRLPVVTGCLHYHQRDLFGDQMLPQRKHLIGYRRPRGGHRRHPAGVFLAARSATARLAGRSHRTRNSDLPGKMTESALEADGRNRRGSGDAVPVRGLMSAESRMRLVAVVAVGVGIGLAWLTRAGQVVYQRRHDHSARRPGMGGSALPGPLVMTREPDGAATAAPTTWGAVGRWTVEAGTLVSRAARRIPGRRLTAA
jgi:hypothetical protein